MRDAFYTILVVWIIWRVLNSVKNYGAGRRNDANDLHSNQKQAMGDTSIKYVPPVKNKIRDDEGEYVDYEEVK
jgi:hypothetical protein